MIEISPCSLIIAQAKRLAARYEQNTGNINTLLTDTKTSQINGFLAELAVASYFKTIGLSSVFDYDLITEDGNTVEVKTTSCNSKPLPNYVATIMEYQNPKADILIFCRALNDHSKVWICAYTTKSYFYANAPIKKPGHKSGTQTYEYARRELEYQQMIQFRQPTKGDN